MTFNERSSRSSRYHVITIIDSIVLYIPYCLAQALAGLAARRLICLSCLVPLTNTVASKPFETSWGRVSYDYTSVFRLGGLGMSAEGRLVFCSCLALDL